MAQCSICTKDTAVSLYIRVKPIWSTGNGKFRAAKKDQHRFFGYWPPDSHLAEYFRLELARGQSILQPLFVNNCRGHSLREIAEAIENLSPPMPGLPIRILWNPSPKVTKFLRSETWREKAEAELEIKNDLRTITVHDKASIKTSLIALFNNTQMETSTMVSYQNIGSRMKASMNGRSN
jgi:hypothetical protein